MKKNHIYTWAIKIDDIWHNQGEPKYWQAIKDNHDEYDPFTVYHAYEQLRILEKNKVNKIEEKENKMNLIGLRKLTRGERNQLAFITKQYAQYAKSEVQEGLDQWLLMSPRFKWGHIDILFIHLVAIGLTPVDSHKTLIYGDESQDIKYYEKEFKEMLFFGGFESTDEFIEYYHKHIMPVIIKGTRELVGHQDGK